MRATVVVGVLILTGCTGGSDEGTEPGNDSSASPSTAASTQTSAPAVELWRTLTGKQRQAYRQAAAAIAPALDDPALVDIGVSVCEGMFGLQTDEKLVGALQKRVADRLGVDLTPAQAGDLIYVTNNHVCPDLAR